MELSPLAREKLAKIGDLSPQEKEKLKLSEDLTALLADYFSDHIDTDGLWARLKKFKESGNEFMIKETQLRLLHALSLGSNNIDFQRCYKGILGCETLKEPNRYSEIETNFNSVEKLRHEYQQEKEKTFNAMKESIRGQVKMAAQQMAQQAGKRNMSIDMERSIEASIKSSPNWKEFVLKHEKSYGQNFIEALARIQSLL